MSSPFTSSSAETGSVGQCKIAATANATGPGSSGNVADLGPVLSEHRGSPLLYLLFGVPGLALGIYALMQGVKAGAVEYTSTGALILVAAIATLVRGKLIAARKLIRHQGGLVLADQWRTHTVPWAELASIRQHIVKHYHNGIPTGTTRTYYLITTGGVRFTLDNHFKKVENLGDDIQLQVTRVQLPLILQQFKQGETVKFGGLEYDRTGISYGRTKVAWAELDGLHIERGILKIQRRGDKAGKFIKGATVLVNVSTLPNLRLMMEFINRVRAALKGATV